MQSQQGDVLVSSWKKIEEARIALEVVISQRADPGELTSIACQLRELSDKLVKEFAKSLESGEAEAFTE